MTHLTDRVIAVTGGAGGMGLAITRTLVARGAKVIVTDLREPHELIEGATYIPHDVTSEADWDTVISTSIERYGRLDGLVNNAGYAVLGSILETGTEMFETTQRVNQLGTFFGMKKFAEARKDHGGVIVNIASCVAMRGVTGQFAYAASKWAIRGMTKCAAIEFAAHKIRVNSINPGPILTPLTEVYSEEQRAVIAGMIPMGRLGNPNEIAAVSAFLLSDEASFITGAEIEADGGMFA